MSNHVKEEEEAALQMLSHIVCGAIYQLLAQYHWVHQCVAIRLVDEDILGPFSVIVHTDGTGDEK